MYPALQACHSVAGHPALAAATRTAAAAACAHAQLPNLWPASQSSSSCCQAAGMHTSPGLYHSADDSSLQATSTSQPLTSKQKTSRPSEKQSKSPVGRLQQLIRSNMSNVPIAARTGDRALLDQSQRDNLALLRRFNISRPGLRGQIILAKVLRTGPKHLLVDPGYYGINVVSRQEMASAAAYDEYGNPVPQRRGADIFPGEYVKLRLSAFNTPYGDAQLDPVGIEHDVRRKLVWAELEHRMKRGLPVQGRILNVTAGGYAVGVAGYVALLQRQQGSVQQTRRIGVLQDFYIHSMDNKRRRITLSNMQRATDMSDVYRATM